ncbi:hypothetical protein NNC58_13055 [Prevotella copri]|jgi:hypothetical protein|uniref:Tetratricopeptide repeat protein n=1 Tax=Segatella copri TaxID=165179 RepID=A0AAW5INR4_9BACT|nr:hypothetical protein [Segatella copri]MCP9535583.1 hypothetical protein [Segatella copri]MCP9538479.1 hypothetical protein [Segatella copri]MCP9541400.1 hypothetical protein [Segatella copri]MCP9559747.1 hypothetical protein [Segatella copri]MCP9562548.1 hypothetical protein [Segatella copri]
MKEKVIYLLLIIMILTSCAGNRKYDDLMQRADSIMNVNDDSAKVAIRMLDGVKSQLPEFSKAQKMRYELLRHKAMNKAYISFTSDSKMKEVVDYYDRHGSANERMLANYVLGCVYRDMHEVPLALEYYNKAAEQADTTAADCDYGTLYRVYSQMGFLFSKQYLPYQLLDAFGKAEKYAYLAKDTLNAIINYQNKGDAYDYLGKKDSVVAINLRSANMFKRIGDNYNAAIALGCNYSYYIEKQDSVNAKKAFEAYFSTGYEGNSNYGDAKAFLLCEKGRYYMFISRLDSAFSCLNQSLKLSKSYSNKAAATKVLAQYYARVNKPVLAMKYALKSSEYNDSDLLAVRESQLQQIQAMYNYGRNQEIARKAELKAERITMLVYVLIAGGVVIFLLLTHLYLKQLKKKKEKILVTKHLYDDSLLKLRQKQEELELLRTVNDRKIADVIKEKEQTINKLEDDLKDIRDKYSNSSLSDVDILLKESSIYKRIKYLELHPKEIMRENDWIELEETIEQLIPSFIPLLKNRLNVIAYRICLLVKLEISTSSIAILLGLSSSAISKYRKVMLEKLCGRSGKPKDFDEYIRQIE